MPQYSNYLSSSMLLFLGVGTRSLVFECALEGQTCWCVGNVTYTAITGGDQGSSSSSSITASVRQSIRCGNDAFGRDPAYMTRKKCLCDGNGTRPPQGDDAFNPSWAEGLDVVPEAAEVSAVTATLAPVLDDDKAYARLRAADVIVPARSSPSYAARCTKTRGLEMASKAERRRVVAFYGMTLLGEPVERGFEIARSQLLSMALAELICPLPDCAKLRIFVTHVARGRRQPVEGRRSGAQAVDEIKRLAASLTGNTSTVHFQDHNEYEHPALHALWSYARSLVPEPNCSTATPPVVDDTLLLYSHNKGVTRSTDEGVKRGVHDDSLFEGYGFRTNYELNIYRQIVGSWRHVIALFDDAAAQAQHLSLTPSSSGVGWYNFWWARPNSIACHREPLLPQEIRSHQKTFDRHYYEQWLGTSARPQEGCKSGFSLARCVVPSCDFRSNPEGAIHSSFHVLRREFAHWFPQYPDGGPLNNSFIQPAAAAAAAEGRPGDSRHRRL
ncbi:hypothetical protein CTAYLR_008607 [Chrysophaeum taylorii]|uniref:Uncharacterized protein n=1 Tax=Chrysophaeum taylorii TaxID=2483200 RepID=A0AAD7XP76_9STRA|nr:hypothetical protein CTAYLR_008607 [Chrysophaeum taylorii]